MKKAKLYKLTSPDFRLPSHLGLNGEIHFLKGDNLPMVCWPNGHWCLPANMYLLSLFQSGLSRRNGGGTLLTYVAHISHLLRFVFDQQQASLEHLTNSQFKLFMASLSAGRHGSALENRDRSNNTVIAIGKTCLDFLNFLGNSSFVVAGKSRNQRWHPSFPTYDEFKRRLPISQDSIDRLNDAIFKCSPSIFIRKRRYVLLKLLEITGGRRSEIANLTVESVNAAATMPRPFLKLLTLKGRHHTDKYRLVPISRHDLALLIEFAEINRAPVIRKTCRAINDDGLLLVSQATGFGLCPNTLTQELWHLRKAAGIEEKACPHMFRHRFITKLFVALLEQHHELNPDEFRNLLLTTEALKQKVQQITGHSSIHSLEHYIHLAHAERTHIGKSYDMVLAHSSARSLIDSLRTVQRNIQDGESLEEGIERVLMLITEFEQELKLS